MKKPVKIVLVTVAAAAVAAAGLGFVITPEAGKAPNDPAVGIKPFSAASAIGSNYYRIPAMITTQDGTVVAAMDARFGGTHDSPNNLEIAVSRSVDGGQVWTEPELAITFEDWENSGTILRSNGSLTTQDSASAIDSSLLEDVQTGRIFMLVDAFPYATGASSAQQGSGYTEVDGQKCLMLRKNGEEEYCYTVHPDGFIYDQDGTKTSYSLNSRYELLENGSPLTVRQKRTFYWYNVAFALKSGKEVPMNILYQDALFQPLPTSYLYLLYSDDGGQTWSDPVDLNGQVKGEDSYFKGVCPGRGIQIQNGEHAGRLIFPVYELIPETGEQRFSVIYSDDHGGSWQAGERIALTQEINNISETQLVQLPDGSLRSFSRTTAGYVGTAFSTDGGQTWSEPQLVREIPLTGGSGCQVSAINYAGKIEGKDAVLLSAPAGESRTNGYIYVGLIQEGADGRPYEIVWTYKKEVTGADTYFAYSCLTQLADGRIGLLYEQANTPQTIDTTVFVPYTVDELCTAAIQ